jgi:hypothetical protein
LLHAFDFLSVSARRAHRESIYADLPYVFGRFELSTHGPVTGSVTFKADSFGAPTQELIAIDLTLGGHTYLLSEIGEDASASADLAGYWLGGVLNKFSSMLLNTNDFWLFLAHEGSGQLAFSHEGLLDTLGSRQFAYTVQELSANDVPEPAVLALMLAGWMAFGFSQSRRRRAGQTQHPKI